jgi:SAM-dependent methyltransferase
MDLSEDEAAWVRAQQQAMYSSGDPAWLARGQQPVALDVVESAGVRRGDVVLDVGCGDGNAALAAARAGARVIAIDLTLRQIRLGIQRAGRKDNRPAWVQADAERLPLQAESVTCVVSNFGIIYAARAPLAIREALRVLRPRGRIVLTAHPVDGFNNQARVIIERHLPPPSGGGVPTDADSWGDPDRVQEWLAPFDVEVGTASRERLGRRYPSVNAWWEDTAAHIPVLAYVQSQVHPQAWDDITTRFRHLASQFGVTTPRTFRPINRYHLITVHKTR